MDRLDALLINVGTQTYALPLLQIQEIRGWSPVSHLPDTDPACLGMLNLRGSVLPIFDARMILGNASPPPPRPQDVIVVAVLDDKPRGLLVDSVSDIVEIDADKISQTGNEDWSSRLIDGIATVGERLVPLLAIQRLTSPRMPEQAMIAAA